MEHNRLGVMGHYYGGMLDIYADLTQQCAVSADTWKWSKWMNSPALRRGVPSDAKSRSACGFSRRHSTFNRIAQQRRARARGAHVGRRSIGSSNPRLGSLAYYYQGTGNPENEDAISSIILGTRC